MMIIHPLISRPVKRAKLESKESGLQCKGSELLCDRIQLLSSTIQPKSQRTVQEEDVRDSMGDGHRKTSLKILGNATRQLETCAKY